MLELPVQRHHAERQLEMNLKFVGLAGAAVLALAAAQSSSAFAAPSFVLATATPSGNVEMVLPSQTTVTTAVTATTSFFAATPATATVTTTSTITTGSVSSESTAAKTTTDTVAGFDRTQ
jgi:hypothetical protein